MRRVFLEENLKKVLTMKSVIRKAVDNVTQRMCSKKALAFVIGTTALASGGVYAQEMSADAVAGQKLFTGEQRFANGGTACIACHSVKHSSLKFGGGTLAVDLSESFEGMGAEGVQGMIEDAPFGSMNMAYKKHPVSADEIAKLNAFLQYVGETRGSQAEISNKKYLAVGGIIGFVVWLGGVGVIWSGRKKLSTKHDILERQIKSQ